MGWIGSGAEPRCAHSGLNCAGGSGLLTGSAGSDAPVPCWTGVEPYRWQVRPVARRIVTANPQTEHWPRTERWGGRIRQSQMRGQSVRGMLLSLNPSIAMPQPSCMNPLNRLCSVKGAHLLCLVSLAATLASAENWPCWRGPRGDGTSLEKELPPAGAAPRTLSGKPPSPARAIPRRSSGTTASF